MALHFEKARAKTICSLEYDIFVLLNDKSRMKGDFHVRFREKFGDYEKKSVNKILL